MARVAFCARLGRRAELRKLAMLLTSRGHEVVSSWIWRDDLDEQMTPAEKSSAARENYNDLHRANVVVLFGEEPHTPGAERGGRFADWGFVAHLGPTIRRIVVGPRENINTFWPEPEVAADEDALVELLGGNR
jgi:hypothetical protein